MFFPSVPSDLLESNLEHVLRTSSRNSRANAEQRPRIGELRHARPEAVLLLAVLLELGVFDRVFFGVTLLLVFFVLPRTS